MDRMEFCEKERVALRDELHSLKRCQITYFTTAITATGVLLGIGGLQLKLNGLHWASFLFPLVVLLPCWWVFYDKAKSIARCVGYYRLLESILLNQKAAKKFVGWENALRNRREMSSAEKKKLLATKNLAAWGNFLVFFTFKANNRYWLIIYHTFFWLSAVCLVSSFMMLGTVSSVGDRVALIPEALVLEYSFLVLVSVFFLLSAFFSARTVLHLLYGKHSYDFNENIWREVLQITDNVRNLKVRRVSQQALEFPNLRSGYDRRHE